MASVPDAQLESASPPPPQTEEAAISLLPSAPAPRADAYIVPNTAFVSDTVAGKEALGSMMPMPPEG